MKHHSVRTWSFRAIPATLLVFTAAALVVAPALAGPPHGNAAKLLASPLVQTEDTGNGLPGITCGGFSWYTVPPPFPADPMDETALDLSLIPFREGPTSIQMWDGTGSVALARVFFRDGLVQGIPYDRNDWNRVTLALRPLTQDSLLTVNGQAAAPVPFDDSCDQRGGCSGLSAFIISGEFLDEGTGWVDSVEVLRGPPTGPVPEILFDLSFDGTCTAPFSGRGAMLISAPPRNAKPKG
ncbi:MAG TPA: hypothetical protein VJV75_11255, partial [Candidatus Polarisedimenticolia bacterium]|nr:hypothetical protein [Candidatus Polarisedimenticolia bacterium]